MFRTIFKKQLMELGVTWFMDRKTGKLRSRGGITGMIILYAVLFGYLAIMFAGAAFLLSDLLTGDYPWLYYAVTGALAFLLGVFGSVFSTYAGLYNAKDNDLMLSLPVPPSVILFARLVVVSLVSLVFEALVMVPTFVIRLLVAPVTVTGIIFPILLIIVINLFITSVTCLLGFLIALLASKFKKKNIMTVIFAVAFLCLYLYLCARLTDVFNAFVEHADKVAEFIRKFLYPFYQIGAAGEGEVLPMLLFTLENLVLLVLTVWIVSRTYLSLATAKKGDTKKKAYADGKTRAGSLGKALFRKEMRRFTSSSVYMLNCGLGVFLVPVAGVALLINYGAFGELMDAIGDWSVFFPALGLMLSFFLGAIYDITAPSVSLEGNSIWIVQSLPIPAVKVLNAKQQVHLLLSIPTLLVFAVCFSVAFRLSVLSALLLCVGSVILNCLYSAAGLFFNLKMPNLHWTNETIPVKQSGSVMLLMLGGWGCALLVGGIGALLCMTGIAELALLGMIAVITVPTVLLNRWLRRRGAEIFSTLS